MDAMKSGMDAALSKIDSLTKQVEVLKKTGMKPLLQEISQRNVLADRISAFTGAFDHSEMTYAEVAQYGVKKLGLKAPQGQEMTALDSYFVNRTPSSAEVGYALDGALTTGKTDELAAFYSTAA